MPTELCLWDYTSRREAIRIVVTVVGSYCFGPLRGPILRRQISLKCPVETGAGPKRVGNPRCSTGIVFHEADTLPTELHPFYGMMGFEPMTFGGTCRYYNVGYQL